LKSYKVLKVAKFGFEQHVASYPQEGIENRPHVLFQQTTFYETKNFFGLDPIKGSVVATAICPLTLDARHVDFRQGLVKSVENINLDG